MEDGPPIFRQDYTCPALLVVRLVPQSKFHLQGYHLLWRGFPSPSVTSNAKSYRLLRFRSPLLSESRLIYFPRVTEMFQFTRFASSDLCIQSGILLTQWVSPFGHLRIKARLPAPRSFSQATTPFFACDRQGIHHVHLVA